MELSAITSGVKEVRDVIAKARSDKAGFGLSTLLFLDEIHRFSKAQQDALLPAVEAGWIVLMAATTENPSFAVIAPLLSRSLVLRLEPLTTESLNILVERAVTDPRGLAGAVQLADGVVEHITALATGDGRRALTILEAAAIHAMSGGTEDLQVIVTSDDVAAALDRALVPYDKNGDQHYDVISAFIKSVRGSDADAAVHYLARMIEAGEDPRFIARRLIILAAEDIGLADPSALSIAVAAGEAVAMIGMPEGRIPLAEATIYLALAAKSNAAYLAINEALDDVRAGNFGDIPKPLRSSNYAGARLSGAGIGYLYPHDDARAVLEQTYLDGPTSGRAYYRPKEIGAERDLAERWSKLRRIIRGKKSH
jgi:putative ATPase